MNSSRLPGKSLMPLAGAPLVARILERVSRCEMLDEVVLAIPDTPGDSALGELAGPFGVKVFAGSEDDLLERYYQAALQYDADIVGRLPADNCTPEPAEIDRIAEFHRGRGARGFSSNLASVMGSQYPDGIGAEMFDFSLLAEAHARCRDPKLREHVHLNFFDYESQTAVDPDWCPVLAPRCPESFRRPDIVLDVNTLEQYEVMRDLYADLYPLNPHFHVTDAIRWHDDRARAKQSAELAP